MKKLLSVVLGCVLCTSVQAHEFWPEEYTVSKGVNDTMIITHLRTPDDAYYKFTLNGIPLGNEQLVYPGSVEEFPIIVPNGLIENDKVTICSLRMRQANQFQQEVCLVIKVL
jgi:hypothetical protein